MTTATQSTILDHWFTEQDLRRRITRRRNQISDMLGEQAKLFFEWEDDNCQPVVISPISQIPPEHADIIRRIKSDFKPKMCYNNATTVSTVIGCDYVEGYATNGILTYAHAWNAIGDINFDVTDELVLNGAQSPYPADPNYMQIVRVSNRDTLRLVLKTGTYGDVKGTMFAETVLKLKSKKAIKQFLNNYWVHIES